MSVTVGYKWDAAYSGRGVFLLVINEMLLSVGDEQEVEDNTEQENFEDRLSECIEGLLAKR